MAGNVESRDSGWRKVDQKGERDAQSLRVSRVKAERIVNSVEKVGGGGAGGGKEMN